MPINKRLYEKLNESKNKGIEVKGIKSVLYNCVLSGDISLKLISIYFLCMNWTPKTKNRCSQAYAGSQGVGVKRYT